MSKFHEDVKAELQEMLGSMPSIEQAIEGVVGSDEAEDWGKGGETRQNDGRVNDVVFGMLLKAFMPSWLKWAGDEIQAKDEAQYKDAKSMLIGVLADLGDFLSDRNWKGREVSMKQFYAETDPNFDTEEGFY